MPVLTPVQTILIGSCVAPTIFALCAFFSRAGWRRTASGLTGAVAYILVQYAWDRAAAIHGWWSYPAYESSAVLPMPIPIYVFAGLVFAGFGLVGWRVIRRYGWKGLVVFLAAWSLWGFIHDTVGSSLFSSSQLMVIGPGAAALITDFLVYTTCMAAALLAIRSVGGPFRSDPLARAKIT